MSRTLIIIGITLVVVGLLWPWLQKIGLGRLPGDVTIEKEHMRLYFPITTSIVVSIIITLLFWLFRK